MKEKLITRTVTTTNAEVMCVDTETADVTVITLTVSGTFDDNNALLKAVKKVHETDTFKVVAIQDTKIVETLYGMPENKFIELAEKLPARKQYV